MNLPWYEMLLVIIFKPKISDDGFKFALSGEGADEVLGGYDYFELFPKMKSI